MTHNQVVPGSSPGGPTENQGVTTPVVTPFAFKAYNLHTSCVISAVIFSGLTSSCDFTLEPVNIRWRIESRNITAAFIEGNIVQNKPMTGGYF